MEAQKDPGCSGSKGAVAPLVSIYLNPPGVPSPTRLHLSTQVWKGGKEGCSWEVVDASPGEPRGAAGSQQAAGAPEASSQNCKGVPPIQKQVSEGPAGGREGRGPANPQTSQVPRGMKHPVWREAAGSRVG